MKTFDDLKFKIHPASLNMSVFTLMNHFGDQAKIFFDNGYGVSVVTGTAAYGEYEVAVLKGKEDDYSLTYDTPITDDVIGCDNKDEVNEIMKKVQEL